ncbi:unnamed protein product [Arabis nemorensis]|uniref:Glabrous enhancer-binding protein-like C-terminal domain-containing protein n=1 Tax=Arabis nemorensis TaxID=586526 RepID=A0A565AMH8_9BRAS|nr:unnamed protein product [Arabis nemorensis]
MAKTEVEERNRTLRLRKKNRRIRSKFPPILGRTLKLRRPWLLARAKKDDKKIGNKSSYQTILIEEDEIVVSQGLIDFKLDKGKSMYEDEMGFYDFVIRSLNNEKSPMSEYLVKERWNMESTETKMRIEEKLRVLEAKEVQFRIEMVEQKANLLKEVVSAMLETVNS